MGLDALELQPREERARAVSAPRLKGRSPKAPSVRSSIARAARASSLNHAGPTKKEFDRLRRPLPVTTIAAAGFAVKR